ncbi:MAG: hypothetical protein LQ338_006906, partial [Usnochroma carphineum]
DLQLIELDSQDSRGQFVLQPRKPMPLQALNETIRKFQVRGFHGRNNQQTGNRVIRMYDWMTADNPLINRYPEIVRGFSPDETGKSYGGKYTWDTVRLVRRVRPEAWEPTGCYI